MSSHFSSCLYIELIHRQL